jgi:hypothetical protein
VYILLYWGLLPLFHWGLGWKRDAAHGFVLFNDGLGVMDLPWMLAA